MKNNAHKVIDTDYGLLFIYDHKLMEESAQGRKTILEGEKAGELLRDILKFELAVLYNPFDHRSSRLKEKLFT